MILDIAPNFIKCEKCGGYNLIIRKTYEVIKSESDKYDNMLDAVNEKTFLICENCKNKVESFDGVVKINYHTNQ